MTTSAATTNVVDRVTFLAPLIREHADEMEADRQMPKAVVAGLLDQNLFRMHVPRYAGGETLSLVDGFPAFEEASRIDGSAGWNLMIGAGSGVLWGYLDDSVVRDIWGAPDSIAGGAVDSAYWNGCARRRRIPVSGRWSFASGSQQMTTFLAGCVVIENGAPVMGPAGPEVIVAFLLARP